MARFRPIEDAMEDMAHRFDELGEELMEEPAEDEEVFLTFAKAKAVPNSLRTYTGLEADEIEELFQPLEHLFEHAGRGRTSKIGPIDKFFYLLTYMRHGFTFEELHQYLGPSASTLCRIIEETVCLIANPLFEIHVKNTLPLPPETPRFANLPEAVGCVDVSLIRINKPKHNQQEYYSAKHHCHGIKLQTVVDPAGLCTDFYVEMSGKKHDIKIFRESGAIDRFSYQTVVAGNQVVKHYQLLFDKGYTGIHHMMPEALVVAKKPRKAFADMTPQEKFKNAKGVE